MTNPNINIKQLNKDLALKYKLEFTKLANLIPQVEYTEESILAEEKERIYYGKWEHSLALFNEDKPIGLLIAYERKAEGNKMYPENTIYISELVIDPDYQKKGLAKKLLEYFFEHSQKIGFKYLDGELNFSIQSNAADWNKHVTDFYKSFGFTQRATKSYDNRVDVVLGWKPQET